MTRRRRSVNERIAIGLRTGRLKSAAAEAEALLREIADLERAFNQGQDPEKGE